MVEIGNYEFERYNAHMVLMQIISFTFIIFIILHFLSKLSWLPIPELFFQITTLFVAIVSIILIVRKIYDLKQRSNQNYLQYDHQYMGSPPSDDDYERKSSWEHNKNSLKKNETDKVCTR